MDLGGKIFNYYVKIELFKKTIKCNYPSKITQAVTRYNGYKTKKGELMKLNFTECYKYYIPERKIFNTINDLLKFCNGIVFGKYRK